MNCQLPEDKIASIEVQLVAAKAVHHLSGLLCPRFDVGQLSTPQQTALHGTSFLSWGKSWLSLSRTALQVRLCTSFLSWDKSWLSLSRTALQVRLRTVVVGRYVL